MSQEHTDVVAEEGCLKRESTSGGVLQPTWEDEAECIEGVGIFKYLGRPLDRLDDDLPEVRQNIKKD